MKAFLFVLALAGAAFGQPTWTAPNIAQPVLVPDARGEHEGGTPAPSSFGARVEPLPPFAAPAPQSGPQRLDLQQSFRLALDNSPRLAELRARKQELRSRVDEAYAAANPSMDLSAGYTEVTPEVAFPGSPGSPPIVIQPAHNYNLAFTVRQALFTFGRLKWSTKAAELSEKSSQEDYRREAESIFAEVATAYFDTRLAERAVEIAHTRLAAQDAQVVDAQNLYKAGTAARFDVLRSQSEQTRVKQLLLAAENGYRLAQDRLLTLLGLPLGSILTLEALPPAAPPPGEVEKYAQQALQLRPELGIIGWALESAKARIHLEDAQNNPRLDLQTQATQRNVTGFVPGTQLTTGLVLSIPLFDGGVSDIRKEAAQHVVEQLEAQLESTRRTVRLDVHENYNTLQNLWEKRAAAAKNVEQASEAVRVAQVRYRSGVSTNVELLSAQAAYGEALLSQATTDRDYEAGWARWRRAISDEYPAYVPGPLLRPRAPEEIKP